MSNIASAIKSAEEALDQGDYNFCITIVDPLLPDFQAETAIGGELRILLVTFLNLYLFIKKPKLPLFIP